VASDTQIPTTGFDLDDEINALDEAENAIVDQITTLEKIADNAVVYPIERVRGNVGRWLIPKKATLAGHLALIKDKKRDIDFSPANYPGFDAIFTERYEGVGFFDPLHDRFPRYAPLRDNLATVRNYLMVQYFPDDSPNDQVRIQHLRQIAEYLAEGLTNDRAFLGLIPNHNPFKPFIDVKRASAPDGEGARYLYEKILEMQRHSDWTRPFSPLTSLFGSTPYGKWDLPELEHSIFAHDAEEVTQEAPDAKDIAAKVAELSITYDALEEKREQLAKRQRLRDNARDIDSLANQLLFSFYQMRDAVEDLAAPIRRDAIDIAHDILRKLSVSLGSTPITNGLSFKPSDDNAALGSSGSVARMLVRMTAMMRSLGEDILLNPAVARAQQAIGQLAYLAKQEALSIATAAGDTKLSSSLREQLSDMRALGVGREGKTFSNLMDHLKEGLDTLEQKLRGAGIAVDAKTVNNTTVGRGSGSQAQAVNTARQQVSQQQSQQSTKQQQGLNQAQQGQAAQMGAQAQASVAQMQAAIKAQTPLTQQQGFSAPAVTVKKAPNGIAALKNARNVQKTIRAELTKASITATPAAPIKPATLASVPTPPPTPPAPPSIVSPPPTPAPAGIDPKLVADLGSSLQKAQSSAGNLTTDAIGPKTAKDAIRKAQADRAVKQSQQESTLDQYERQLNATPKQPQGPSGRSR
jgi:hypothetical protein